MAFRQLHYTSCETGLAGYGGYQFTAVTPGISPAVMREVEDRSVYEPPRWLLADPCLDEPEAYPIALSYWKSEATGAAALTHVMFAGTDYSGRPGNYFAHALVTSTPERDFGSLLPAELWGAQLWQSAPVVSTELPELPGPLPRGTVDRAGVQAFLDARGTERVLPELLTAVWRAMAGDRLVLLASHDANENIWWIAAVSYLLGEHLAPRMTFTTYSHTPGYSRHHLVGIESDAVPPDADSAFQLFDLDAGKTPGGDVHPLAALLAGTGVMSTDGLWRQAAAFASGAEEGPDDWYGPVAAAVGLLRGRLSARDTEAVVRWLSAAAGRIPAEHAGVVLGVALAQPDAALADEHLLSLLGLAQQLRSPAQEERLEHLLVKRAIRHIARGEQAPSAQLGPTVAHSAQAEISSLLRTAAPAVALAALEWAATARAMPSEAELVRYGQNRLAPDAAEPELTRILSLYPAIRRGFLERLAQAPRQVAGTVLAGPVGHVVTSNDLASYPELTEEWLLILADRGRTEPQHAYDCIVDIRMAAQRSPFVDAVLLERLWPAGCPPAQVSELLGVMADLPDPDLRHWFVRQIQAAAVRGTESAAWVNLAQALASRSLLHLLPDELARVVERTASSAAKLRRAHSAVSEGDVSVFAELYADHMAADSKARLSPHDLARLLYEAEPLALALRGCPVDVMEAFCDGLGTWLAPSHPDVRLATRVVGALTDPELWLHPKLGNQLAEAFEQVNGWHRSDLRYLESLLSANPEVARKFREWRESRRSVLVRKLFGGRQGPTERR
jgi:hypothetical protein